MTILTLVAALSLAAVPHSITVQGRAQSLGGTPVDGTYKMLVTLYETQDGEAELWTQTFPGVAVGEGVFSLALEDMAPTLFAGATTPWVGIKIEGDPELPRQRITAAPTALLALTSMGLECSGCVGTDALSNGAVGAAALADGAVTAAKIGISCELGKVLGMTVDGWACAADGGHTYGPGVGLVLGEGIFALDLTFADARYVNAEGDTMSGTLTINGVLKAGITELAALTVLGGGSFGGGVQVGTDDSDCTPEKAGTLRWTGERIQVCGGAGGAGSWQALNPAVCGNEILEAPEQCDDGNDSDTDACVSGCVKAKCGDGFKHQNVEECDNGGLGPEGGCDALCKLVSKDGCAAGTTFKKEIEPDLWLCAKDNITGNNDYVDAYSACNEAQGFHMGTVASMTRRGLPSDANIDAAMTWAAAQGYDYAVTGQPVRSFSWDYAATPYETTNCGSGGLGYISTGEKNQAGSNWQALTDGNAADFRSWPSANCVEVSNHTLVSLCQDSTGDPLAYLFDHRWR